MPPAGVQQPGAYAPPGYQPVPHPAYQPPAPAVFGGGMSGPGYQPPVVTQPQTFGGGLPSGDGMYL